MSKYLRIVISLAVFLLPILCNLVQHTASWILSVLTLLGIYGWITSKKSPIFSFAEKAIMWAFASYFLISVFFFLINGMFRGASFHWDLGHELRFLAFIPVYFLFARTDLKTWTIWYGSAAAAIICGLFATNYFIGMHTTAGNIAGGSAISILEKLRVTGAYNAIPFGHLSLAFGFMSFAGIRHFHSRHPLLVVFPALALAGGILSCFLSGTRGAIISIPFLLLILFIQMGTFRSPWRKRIALVLAVSVLSAGFYFMPGSVVNQRFKDGFAEAKMFFKGKGTGFYVVRLAMWNEAWEIIADHPFIGTGKGGYHDIIEAKVAKNEAPKNIRKFDSPHSNYLTALVDYGIWGLIVLMAVFLTPLLILIPALKVHWPRNDMAYTGIMLLVAFMIYAATETIFIRSININVYVVMLAAALNLAASNEQTSDR